MQWKKNQLNWKWQVLHCQSFKPTLFNHANNLTPNNMRTYTSLAATDPAIIVNEKEFGDS